MELGGSPYLGKECLTRWARGAGVTYRLAGTNIPSGLYWGRPDGHRLDEGSFGRRALKVLRANEAPHDSLKPIGKAFSFVQLQRHYDSYTPPYGRDQAGVWRAGGGKTYRNVIRVLFVHGTRYKWIPEKAGNSACANHPFRHFPDYNSYWVWKWLAPGEGVIREMVLFMEHAVGIECDGAAVNRNPRRFRSYIDDAR